MLDIKPMAGALGAEIHGLDLSGELGEGDFAPVRKLLNEYQVIFIRDQDISPANMKALALSFGPVQTHPAYETVEGFPEITILESTPEKPTKIETWHTDMTFLAEPPFASILIGREIPPIGGDTLWMSLYAAYEALPTSMKDMLEDKVAIHDMGDFRNNFATNENTTTKHTKP